MGDKATKATVGERIRMFREKPKMTLGELATKSGVPAADIAAIEYGEIMPSLGILTKLSNALGQRLGTFTDDQFKPDPIITRADDLTAEKVQKIPVNELGYSARSLALGKPDRHMDPFRIEFVPNRNHKEVTHEGEELIICLDGEVELLYNSKTYILEKGDCAYYNATERNSLRAVGQGKPASIYGIIFQPTIDEIEWQQAHQEEIQVTFAKIKHLSIPRRIQHLRIDCKMSQKELGQKIGMDEEHIRDLEAGVFIPSLGDLQKLSCVLGQRLSVLTDEDASNDPVISKASERHTVQDSANRLGYVAYPIAAGKLDRYMEPFAIKFDANGVDDVSSHEGEELIICLDGEVELTYGGEKQILKPGDTAYYNCVVKHGLRALNGKTASIYGIIFMP